MTSLSQVFDSHSGKMSVYIGRYIGKNNFIISYHQPHTERLSFLRGPPFIFSIRSPWGKKSLLQTEDKNICQHHYLSLNQICQCAEIWVSVCCASGGVLINGVQSGVWHPLSICAWLHTNKEVDVLFKLSENIIFCRSLSPQKKRKRKKKETVPLSGGVTGRPRATVNKSNLSWRKPICWLRIG